MMRRKYVVESTTAASLSCELNNLEVVGIHHKVKYHKVVDQKLADLNDDLAIKIQQLRE